MNAIERTWWTAKGVNWRNLPRRLLQAWRVRTGALRRRLDPAGFSEEAFAADGAVPVENQPFLWAQRARGFFQRPPAEALLACAGGESWRRNVVDRTEKALGGEYPFFSHWFARLGWPPRFNFDPASGVEWPTGVHWLDKADRPTKDVKLAWEPSRFSLAYDLARAYAATRDERWAEAFWTMFDAWITQNPPELSVAWSCGQEMTFRLMAMLFGAIMTLDAPAARPERLYALSHLAWQTGKHINININHALMQGNNHALSEATGLWTVGLLFPEFRSATAWRDRGRRVLAREVAWQVYDDGSYVQHSLSYHRLMLDDLLWAIRLGEVCNEPLPQIVYEKLRSASDWLVEMIDPDSGRAPNYGANDGANVLPLSCCDYGDYRPAAQAARYLAHGERCFPRGEWDEKLLWLFGPQALDAPVSPPGRTPGFAAAEGGYYVLRGPNSWAMTRCHTYRHRPGQADMLHVDLWYKGLNVLRDAGSYMYKCDPPWKGYFPSASAHNTVTVDDQDQMVRGPRFLWFRWTRSNVVHFAASADGRAGYFEGEHYGFSHLPGRVVHRRGICRLGDSYVILDEITGEGRHRLTWRWRLCPAQWRLSERTCTGVLPGGEIRIRTYPAGDAERTLPRLDESAESIYYGLKHAAAGLVLSAECTLPVRVLTWIRLPEPRGESPGEDVRDILIAVRAAIPTGASRFLTDDWLGLWVPASCQAPL
jgi:hypothetical protein